MIVGKKGKQQSEARNIHLLVRLQKEMLAAGSCIVIIFRETVADF